MCMGMAGMGGMGLDQTLSVPEAFGALASTLALTASQFLIILTSGPALAILTALVLILAIAALLRVLFTRRAAGHRDAHSSRDVRS